MGKRILVIDGHPDPDAACYCHALADAYLAGARAVGHEARLLTLAECAFPLLRSAADFATPPDAPAIVQARDDLLWAEHIVIIFPLWLGGAPAFLRAFLEQVARASFVADIAGYAARPKLKGRSARLIVTMGMPEIAYRLLFHADGVRNIASGVLGLGGVRPVRLSLLGSMGAVSETRAKARLKGVHRLGRAGE